MADEDFRPGLRYAETRGQKSPYQAVGDAGQAHGAYQIHPIMYQDIQQTFPHEWGHVSYDQMLADPALQDRAAASGLQMLHTKYGLFGDAILSAWKTGPTQARRGVLNQAYVNTVHEGQRRAAPMRRFK